MAEIVQFPVVPRLREVTAYEGGEVVLTEENVIAALWGPQIARDVEVSKFLHDRCNDLRTDILDAFQEILACNEFGIAENVLETLETLKNVRISFAEEKATDD